LATEFHGLPDPVPIPARHLPQGIDIGFLIKTAPHGLLHETIKIEGFIFIKELAEPQISHPFSCNADRGYHGPEVVFAQAGQKLPISDIAAQKSSVLDTIGPSHGIRCMKKAAYFLLTRSGQNLPFQIGNRN
jgi:hypothetical protein